MLLKIGELAKRTGLTVRALHHYDAIGLLSPSARSDAGYRLYNEADIARLHRILALRRFGLALADIGTTLTRADLSLATVVARQIGLLTEQIQQAKALRSRLSQLQGQLADGQEPDLADWLTTLEHMTMYDKYFSQEELTQLPIYTQADDVEPEWQALVAQVQALMDAGTDPGDPRAQASSMAWMTKVRRDTGDNPILFAKLNAMHEHEPSVQERTGISPQMMTFILAASKATSCRSTGTISTTANLPSCAPTSASAMPSGHRWWRRSARRWTKAMRLTRRRSARWRWRGSICSARLQATSRQPSKRSGKPCRPSRHCSNREWSTSACARSSVRQCKPCAHKKTGAAPLALPLFDRTA
jgi:DNA-binding transcriptional MerR regulator